MKKLILFVSLGIACNAEAQDSLSKLTEVWTPVPRTVTPGRRPADAPSDAVILYGTRRDTLNWSQSNGKPFAWKCDDSTMTVTAGAGEIRTKQAFGDCQLHIEW